MAASSRFTNVSGEEIAELNISAVPKSTQYATKYGVKIFKSKTASLIPLVYFETEQKAQISTARASQQVSYNHNSLIYLLQNGLHNKPNSSQNLSTWISTT